MRKNTVHQRLFSRFLFALVFLASMPSQALEHWYVPRHGISKAWVSNPSPESQLFWLSGPVENYTPEWEKTIEVPGRSARDITALLPKGTFFHGKSTSSANLKLHVQDIKGRRTEWPKGSGLEHFVLSPRSSSWVVTNLTPFPQKVYGAGTQILSLQGFEQKVISLPSGRFQIQSDLRLQVTEWSPQGLRPRSPSSNPVPLKPPPGAYFLVTNPNQTSSFTVRITDPQLIREARRQIQEPHIFLPRILFGEVRAGHQNQNRDWTSSSRLPWSWSIEVLQFGEMASQACDGGAEMLEEVVMPWMKSDSLICFWSYKITRELTLEQMASGRP